jgi:hypothetical protein
MARHDDVHVHAQNLIQYVDVPGNGSGVHDRGTTGEYNIPCEKDAVFGHVHEPHPYDSFRAQSLDLATFQGLLPGSPGCERLALLTRLYLQDPLDFDAELVLAEGQARTSRLGEATMSRLGLDTWVFSGEHMGEASAAFPLQ